MTINRTTNNLAFMCPHARFLQHHTSVSDGSPANRNRFSLGLSELAWQCLSVGRPVRRICCLRPSRNACRVWEHCLSDIGTSPNFLCHRLVYHRGVDGLPC